MEIIFRIGKADFLDGFEDYGNAIDFDSSIANFQNRLSVELKKIFPEDDITVTIGETQYCSVDGIASYSNTEGILDIAYDLWNRPEVWLREEI